MRHNQSASKPRQLDEQRAISGALVKSYTLLAVSDWQPLRGACNWGVFGALNAASKGNVHETQSDCDNHRRVRVSFQHHRTSSKRAQSVLLSRESVRGSSSVLSVPMYSPRVLTQ